jgi:predicted enzyme related to lactoylglutathione lyase
LSYLSVADVDAAVKQFKQQNCEIHRKPFDLPDRGRVAVVSDPQGAVVVLIRSNSGDPEDVEAKPGEWLWTELLTQDDDAASTFYQQLLGYDDKVSEGAEGRQYHVLSKDDIPRAGIVKNPWENIPANWLPYILVNDPQAVSDKARELGGTIFLAPKQDIRQGSVALIADPTGAGFAVQKWPY